MIIYAHRGNVSGISPRENHPDFIRLALEQGFGVEVDLWQVEGRWLLGHDGPQFPIEIAAFDRPDVIFHLKTPHLPSLAFADAFALDQDPYALTLRGRLWTNYGQPVSATSIACAPELVRATEPLAEFAARCSQAFGVCTDHASELQQILKGRRP
jgi:hypothetical protein